MAKAISSVVAIGASINVALEHVACDMEHLEEYWMQQVYKMEDIFRLNMSEPVIWQRPYPLYSSPLHRQSGHFLFMEPCFKRTVSPTSRAR